MKKNFFLLVLSVTLLFSCNNYAEDISDITFDDLLDTQTTVAGKKTQRISEAPAIISVITDKEIAALGATNLYEVLSFIPGVNLSETYYGYTAVNIRGNLQNHYNNKSLVLLNNHPLYETIVGTYYLEQIPLNLIERIEIIRGPGSTLYGTNAYAGVIKIITKNGSDLNGAQIKTLGGSFSTNETSIAYGNQKEDLAVAIAINYVDSKGYEYKVASDEEGLSGSIDYENNFINSMLSLDYKDLIINAGYFQNDKDKFGLIPTLASTGERTIKGFFIDMSYLWQFSEQWSLNFLAYYDDFSKDEFIAWYPPLSTYKNQNIGEAEDQEYAGSKMGTDIQLTYNLTDANRIILGIFYEIQKTDPYWFYVHETTTPSLFGTTSWSEYYSSYDYSAYTQIDSQISDNTSVVAGIRYNNNKDYGSKFIPKTGLVYTINSDATLKILYGKAFRSANFFEKYVNTKNVLYGDNTLNPESIETIDIGIDYRLNKENSLRINYFYLTTNNLITRSQTTLAGEKGATQNTPQYGNTDGQKISGIEMEFKGLISNETLKYFANISYLKGEEQTDSSDIDFIPEFLANAGINYNLNQNFTLSPYMQYVGSQKGTLTSGNTATINPYTLINLNINCQLTDNLNVFATIKNLLDKKYSYAEYIRKNIAEVPGGPARSFYLGINYNV